MKFLLLLLAINVFNLINAQSNVSEERIKVALLELSRKYDLLPSDIEEYRISDEYVQKKNGSTHLYLNQTIQGLDVFNAQIQLHFSKKGNLVFSNSGFIREKKSKINSSTPLISLQSAFFSVSDTLKIPLSDTTNIVFETIAQGKFKLVNDKLFSNPVRIQLGFESAANKLILAYKFNLESHIDKKMYAVFIDAISGEVIRVINKTLSCKFDHPSHTESCLLLNPISEVVKSDEITPKTSAGYRAFPLGIESPLHGNRSMIIDQENTIASPFGWHDVDGILGHEYTITNGNNVYAYEDTLNSDFFGYSPDGGSSLFFDFPMNLLLNPISNLNASLTNLFVWNNFMHDVTYHYGFDEASGNFQANNYGNAGFEMDQVFAEGLDGGGSNNANFATPEDGFNPKMQMYLFNHSEGNLLNVNAPSNISGSYQTGISGFGLGSNFPNTTADLVLVNASDLIPSQGCETILNSAEIAGKIAVVDRGTCPFYDKVLNIQNAGAVGVIVVNSDPQSTVFMGGSDFGEIFIPVISVSQNDGNLLKSTMLLGVVNATLGGVLEPYFIDSDFDNGVIAHEYGHGISNRLTGGPSLVDCLWNSEQAGEGWSDFFALVMTNSNGNTAAQTRAIGNYAFNLGLSGNGIRPYPYSRDMAFNPLTYSFVTTAESPHAIGTVWCTMLWDLYWNMVDAHGNSNDLYAATGGNNKTIQLVMEGMRMQTCSPGFVDSRDAILAADELLFNGENKCIIWQTFARRGLGFSAVQGSSEIGDETEAFDVPIACFGVGLNEEVNSFDFNVFPVPSKSILNIFNTKGLKMDKLTVFDLSGKEVGTEFSLIEENQLDISKLNSGSYLLKIQVGESVIQKRFVVL
jgi:hypothetical protein